MGFKITWDIPTISSAVLDSVAREIFSDAKEQITLGAIEAAREPHQNVKPGRTVASDNHWFTRWEITPPRPHKIPLEPFTAKSFDHRLHFLWSKIQLNTSYKPHAYPWAPGRWVNPPQVSWHADYPPRREIYSPVVSRTRANIEAKLAAMGPEIVALLGE